jgi:hypothetical protein
MQAIGEAGGDDVNKTSITVRIVAIPQGEPPLWVREQWVGLELPLARGPSAASFYGFGAISGPRTCLAQIWGILSGRAERIMGYPVYADRAVEILAEASPKAAAWWRENAAELVAPGRYLLFHARECEVLKG